MLLLGGFALGAVADGDGRAGAAQRVPRQRARRPREEQQLEVGRHRREGHAGGALLVEEALEVELAQRCDRKKRALTRLSLTRVSRGSRAEYLPALASAESSKQLSS